MQRPMQKMRHGVMPLNSAAPIDIDRDTNRFARLRCAAFCQGRTMNKNLTAFLRINDAKHSYFRTIMTRDVEQTTIADLSTHFGIARCPIENDIEFLRLLARQDCLDN